MDLTISCVLSKCVHLAVCIAPRICAGFEFVHFALFFCGQQQHSKYLQRLIAAMNEFKSGQALPPKTECNPFSSESTESALWTAPGQRVRSGVDAHGHGHGHGANSVGSPFVAMKEVDYQAILQRLGALEQRHNDQAKEISNLTCVQMLCRYGLYLSLVILIIFNFFPRQYMIQSPADFYIFKKILLVQ